MKKIQSNRVKFADEKYLGPEPVYSVPITSSRDMRLAHAYNWYNYFYTVPEARKWVHEYVLKTRSKEDYAAIAKAPDDTIRISMCANCRLILQGMTLPVDIMERLNDNISLAVKAGRARKQQAVVITAKPVVSIQEKIEEKANTMIADIEEAIDKFVTSKYKSSFSPYDFLNQRGVKAQIASKIAKYYVPLRDELYGAIKKEDEQLVEAYSRLKKQELQSYHNFIDLIVQDCERLAHNKVVSRTRKPRKKKQKSALQIVGKLRYKKEYPELKIASVDPVQIVGAQSVWIYNYKTEKLSVLHASDEKGLSCKGTTIINVDEAKSIQKKLRKPEQTIERLLSGGKVVLRNLMSDIKTKGAPASGRINAETLILRTQK